MTSLTRSIAFFDQYSFIGGGQVILLSSIEAALRVADCVALAAPSGGALTGVVQRQFGSLVQIVVLPEVKLTHGRKGLADAMRLAGYTLRMVVRTLGLTSRTSLLYANGPRQFPAVFILSLLFGRRCCYHIHIDHSGLEKSMIGIIAGFPKTFRLIVNSPYVYRKLMEATPSLVGSKKVVVIENALSKAFSARSFVNRFNGYRERLEIVVLGVVRPEKGQDIAIDLARSDSRLTVHIIGRVGEGAELWTQNLKDSAPPNVTFHPVSTDVPATLDRLNAHVNLVPSRWEEPFGLVAIEGMACSCITLVSNSGNLPAIAANTGAIVWGDISQLRQQISQLLQLPKRDLCVIAENQFSKTMTHYNAERFITQVASTMASGLAPAHRDSAA